MPVPRLLVMEGNSPETRAEHEAVGGVVASVGYAKLLQELLPNAVVDVCFPGDPGAALPQGSALESYDGVTITGSSLHIYNGGAEITQQIELTRCLRRVRRFEAVGVCNFNRRRRRCGKPEGSRTGPAAASSHEWPRTDVCRQARRPTADSAPG